jgi:hypothetical protein
VLASDPAPGIEALPIGSVSYYQSVDVELLSDTLHNPHISWNVHFPVAVQVHPPMRHKCLSAAVGYTSVVSAEAMKEAAKSCNYHFVH